MKIELSDKYDYSDMMEELLYASSTMKNLLGENTIRFKASMNLVMENTLEGYHVPLVHKATFGAQGLTMKAYENNFYLNGSSHRVKAKKGEFHHITCYPNITIGISGPTTYIGYLDQDGEYTNFHYKLYGPNVLKHVALEFTDKVLNEDREIVERQQIALDLNPTFKPILTDLEPRVKHFMEWYEDKKNSSSTR